MKKTLYISAAVILQRALSDAPFLRHKKTNQRAAAYKTSRTVRENSRVLGHADAGWRLSS